MVDYTNTRTKNYDHRVRWNIDDRRRPLSEQAGRESLSFSPVNLLVLDLTRVAYRRPVESRYGFLFYGGFLPIV